MCGKVPVFLHFPRPPATGVSQALEAHANNIRNFALDAAFLKFFAYSWKLPAYSGAFLLAVANFSFFTCSWSFFAYSFSFFTYSWSFFAYSGKVRLIRAVSKEA